MIPRRKLGLFLGADTCKGRQTPGELSLIIWRQGGPGEERRAGAARGSGGGEGCYVPNCCIPTLSRSTLMQEIHLVVGITKEISSHDHPERSYVALSLSFRGWITRWKCSSATPGKCIYSGWAHSHTAKVNLMHFIHSLSFPQHAAIPNGYLHGTKHEYLPAVYTAVRNRDNVDM